ncbi:MAG: riboflavin synthase [Chloroflexota bacterium]
MFTGIVEETGKVIQAGVGKLVISARDTLKEMKPGDSISVNGVCLTITSLNSSSFSVDIMAETIKRTNLGLLKAGDKVDLERPMALGSRLGGHLVQGHIDDTGRVASIKGEGDAKLITFEASPQIMRYIVEKGFIAVDGISLTVIARDANSFQVSIVGFTREHTILGDRKVGDLVNIEVDIIGKYVEQFNQVRPSGLTMELLQKAGF